MIAARGPEELLEAVREGLKQRGVTQVELAKHLGFSAKHMNQVIHGKAGLGLHHMFEILAYLEVGVMLVPMERQPTMINGKTNDYKRAAT
jgi:transcriptional regulator with XRE-family HTH domain